MTLPLFDDPVQPRRSRREGSAVYAAVLTLRGHGYTVTRAGRHHFIDSRLFTDAELIDFARAFPARRPTDRRAVVGERAGGGLAPSPAAASASAPETPCRS